MCEIIKKWKILIFLIISEFSQFFNKKLKFFKNIFPHYLLVQGPN